MYRYTNTSTNINAPFRRRVSSLVVIAYLYIAATLVFGGVEGDVPAADAMVRNVAIGFPCECEHNHPDSLDARLFPSVVCVSCRAYCDHGRSIFSVGRNRVNPSF